MINTSDSGSRGHDAKFNVALRHCFLDLSLKNEKRVLPLSEHPMGLKLCAIRVLDRFLGRRKCNELTLGHRERGFLDEGVNLSLGKVWRLR